MKVIIRKMVIWIFGAISLLVVTLFAIGYFVISAPKYKGEPSAHFDGEKFFNPNQVKARGFLDVIKWSLNRDQGEWKALTDEEYGTPPPDKVGMGDLRITFINHATMLVQMNGLNILTDPIWSNRTSPFSWIGPKRVRPPGIRFEYLPKIDVVLISHNHYDHLDVPTLKRLHEKYEPKIFTPLGVKQFLEEKGISGATDMDWWDEISLNEYLKLVSIPAQHFSGRGMADRDATLWCGYVLESRAGNVFFAGDTGYSDVMFKEIGDRYGPMRLALIPIGAYQPRWFMSPIHVSPAEAVKIHQDIKSQKSIAMHFGTFPLADDGMKEPVRDLDKALKASEVSAEDFMVLEEGEGRMIKY